MGHADASAEDIEIAEAAFADAPSERPGFFQHWDGIRLAGFRGSCAVLLRQPSEATAVLGDVARNTPDTLVGPYTAVLSDLAAGHAQDGDVDRACSLLHEVLTVAAKTRTPERANRVRRTVNNRLHTWAESPQVRQLEERLRQVISEGRH